MDYRYKKIVLIPLFSLMVVFLAAGCVTLEPASAPSAETGQPLEAPTLAIPPTATDTPQPVPTSTPTAPPGIDVQKLGNMTYQLDIAAQALPESGGSVTLTDGHFEQPIPDLATGVVVDLVDNALGDLNADGVEDAAALLAINTGGTGTFMQLAAVLQQAGQPVHTATRFLGDRVRVESLGIEDGVLQVKMITHAPEDPMCCPTQPVTQTYTLQGDLLVTPEQSQVLPLAETAIQALKAGDMTALAALVHPEDGLRFSPYSYVLPEHLAFSLEQLPGLLDDPNIYTWGAFDGSGEPIQMTFKDYFSRFVYSKDFANAKQFSLDQRLGQGNTIDNSHEFYPQAVVVEYYFPGENPDYGGMDWQSLRLVFQQVDGKWYLIGVIHDEWTI